MLSSFCFLKGFYIYLYCVYILSLITFDKKQFTEGFNKYSRNSRSFNELICNSPIYSSTSCKITSSQYLVAMNHRKQQFITELQQALSDVQSQYSDVQNHVSILHGCIGFNLWSQIVQVCFSDENYFVISGCRASLICVQLQ